MLDRGRTGLVPDPAEQGRDDFLNRHRLALKTKLLHTVDALETSRRNETRLRGEVSRMERLLSETQHVTRAGTWHLNPRTGVVTVAGGMAERLGFPSPDLPRHQLWRHIHPEDRGPLAAAVLSVQRGGPAKNIRIRLVDTGGVPRDLVVGCHGARVDGRRTLSGVVQDITRIAHEERLRVHAHTMMQAERRSRDEMHAMMAPRRLPASAGVDLAAVYLSAPDRVDTGADWYDSLPLPDGRVLLSVASTAGHRLPGPAVAGPLRAVLRAYAVENPEPADVLARLNNYLTTTGLDETYVTALVALFDPADGQLCLANAGHPAPLVINLHNGIPRVRRLGTVDPPLGIHVGVAFQTHRLSLTPDTTVYAYTDGLVDDYGRAAPDLTRLGSTVIAAMTAPPHDYPVPSAQRLLNQALRSALRTAAPLQDDLCMLVLRLPS
jgi:serine phosphatase RsbU (regulator of sigma subunit)